jgi:hypothetical protein
MKKMNYKIIALTASITLLLSGCETMQKASTAMGSTGTGVIAGVAAGAGTGFACDKLTGGKHTGACVAAGMAVGAAVGTWAAKMDEEAEKSVPAMDCTSVKRRMNYTGSTPKAILKFAEQPAHVVKPGEALKIPVKMDLATAGAEGEEQELTFKNEVTSAGEKNTGRAITKGCGGDYLLPWAIPTEKEGVYNSTIKLVNASDNSEIEGGVLSFCYTVAKDGVDKCGKAQSVQPASFDQPAATSSKKAKKKGKGKK